MGSWKTLELYKALLRGYYFVGANMERFDLRDRDLRGINFTDANLRGADLSNADCRGAIFIRADLSRTCWHGADCESADLSLADMSMSYLKGVNFSKARFWSTTMRRCYAKNAIFFDADMRLANVAFTDFLGSRFNGANTDLVKNAETATFYWYIDKDWRGQVHYEPGPGLRRVDESVLGGMSLGENAGRHGR